MSARSKRRTRDGWKPPATLLALYRENLPEALGRGSATLSAMRRAVDERVVGVLDADDGAVMVWYDLHLGHANVIRFQERPFGSLGEMDAVLWAAWETGIGPDHALICVGDFALGPAQADATWHRVRAAPGRRKVLVMGNHDLDQAGALLAHGFHTAKALLVSGGDPPLIWTHAPLPNVPAGHVNIAHPPPAAGLAAHQRVRRAARLPARISGPSPTARAGPSCRRAARGRDHAGADRGG